MPLRRPRKRLPQPNREKKQQLQKPEQHRQKKSVLQKKKQNRKLPQQRPHRQKKNV